MKHHRYTPHIPGYPLADYHSHTECYQPDERPVRNLDDVSRPYLTLNATEVLLRLRQACYAPTADHESCDPRNH